jgi:DNA-binding PucR family transcriptional regulator
VYAVLSAQRTEVLDARRFANGAVRHASSALQQQVYAAIGSAVDSVSGTVISRQQADRVMRVLLRADNDWSVAGLDDVRAHAGLLEVLDLIGDRPHLCEGPLDRLAQESADKRAVLLDTLRAYLDHHGDVRAASNAMNVHANTFRYRLGRACALARVDLDDPTERLMLSLQLRLRS